MADLLPIFPALAEEQARVLWVLHEGVATAARVDVALEVEAASGVLDRELPRGLVLPTSRRSRS
mgnify:CR=1 FL=1